MAWVLLPSHRFRRSSKASAFCLSSPIHSPCSKVAPVTQQEEVFPSLETVKPWPFMQHVPGCSGRSFDVDHFMISESALVDSRASFELWRRHKAPLQRIGNRLLRIDNLLPCHQDNNDPPTRGMVPYTENTSNTHFNTDPMSDHYCNLASLRENVGQLGNRHHLLGNSL